MSDNNSLIPFGENCDITELDLDGLKTALAETLLEKYDNLVYTDENIDAAKEDAKFLNKQKKILDDGLKAYQKQCLEPYEILAEKVKELTGMIDVQRNKIKGYVDDYDARLQADNKAVIRDFYDKKSSSLGRYAQPLFEKLYKPSWAGKTNFKKKDYQQGLISAISKAADDLNEIISWKSASTETIIETYINTLSLDNAESKCREIEAIAKNIGAESKTQQTVEPLVAETKADALPETLLKIRANENQLNRIIDFLEINGISYDICR